MWTVLTSMPMATDVIVLRKCSQPAAHRDSGPTRRRRSGAGLHSACRDLSTNKLRELSEGWARFCAFLHVWFPSIVREARRADRIRSITSTRGRRGSWSVCSEKAV